MIRPTTKCTYCQYKFAVVGYIRAFIPKSLSSQRIHTDEQL